MGATKKMQMEEAELDSEIEVDQFMRANGIEFIRSENNIVIIVVSNFVQGELHVSNSITRREAIGLLRGLGLPVPQEFAG